MPVKGKKAEPEVLVPDSDIVAQLAVQKQLHDYVATANSVEPPPVKSAQAKSKATRFICSKDTRIATATSGPILIRKGQTVSSPSLIAALRKAKIELHPVT